MSQSMNGLSLFSGNGISDADNIGCNNISCNNLISSNISTENMNALQTIGVMATYSGIVYANKIQSTDISSNNLSSTFIKGTDISCNNLFSTFTKSTDISCNNILSTFIKSTDISSNKIFSTDISCNTFFSNSISCDNIKNIRDNCGLLLTPSSVENILIGVSSGNYMSSGCSYNIGIGHQCYDSELTSNSSGNIALGFKAGLNMKGGDNIYLGNLSGILGTDINSYSNSCCIGNNSYISASNTIFLGTPNESVVARGDFVCQGDISSNFIACSSINSGSIGCTSLSVNNSEITSTMIENLSNIDSNVQDRLDRISKNSGLAITTGISNLALSDYSLLSCTTGDNNIAIGQNSLLGISVGNNNIGIGQSSGFGLNQSAENCICIGTESGQSEPASSLISNSVAIGNQAKFELSNQISIGSSLHTTVFAGKIEGPNIISKTKMKYGRVRGNTNNNTTVVFFDVPFPVGSLPMIQLTKDYAGPVLSAASSLYVTDYAHSYFAFDYIVGGIHAEASIYVNWMAMIP